MHRSEADNLVKYLNDMFDENKRLNAVQQSWWIEKLLPLSLSNGSKAIEFVVTESRFGPDRKKLMEFLKDHRTTPESGEVKKIFYIGFICQEAGKLPAGHFETFDWLADLDNEGHWLVPTMEYLNHQVEQQYQQQYDGRWIHMLAESYSDIHQQARTFDQNPLVGLAAKDAAKYRKGTPDTRQATETERLRQVQELRAVILQEEVAKRKEQFAPADALEEPEDFNPNREMKDDNIPY